MVSTRERILWGVLAAVMLVFAIPWFLWGDASLLLGLPVWLWWHMVWLALAAVALWVFARRAWGIGITGGEHA